MSSLSPSCASRTFSLMAVARELTFGSHRTGRNGNLQLCFNMVDHETNVIDTQWSVDQ